MLKFVRFKSCKAFHYILKLYSNMFSELRGSSLALEAKKSKRNKKLSKETRKITKFIEKSAKICDFKK